MESKKYEIKTLDQLLNAANPDNIERLALDFALYLGHYVFVVDKIKKDNPKLKDIPNTKVIKSTFNWIDDGKNDLLGVKVTDPNTGETTYHDYTKG